MIQQKLVSCKLQKSWVWIWIDLLHLNHGSGTLIVPKFQTSYLFITCMKRIAHSNQSTRSNSGRVTFNLTVIKSREIVDRQLTRLDDSSSNHNGMHCHSILVKPNTYKAWYACGFEPISKT